MKKFLCVVVLASGLQLSWGFALLGPGTNGGVAGDAWEQPIIGYGVGGDIGTPKNLGEEFRPNTPVMYYTMDANFLDYFGSNGIVAIDQAFAIMNGVTNVNGYSTGLSEFPLNSQAINYTASALALTDLKSITLGLLTEQMGLAEPDRFVWTLHDRFLPNGNFTCEAGDEEFLVVQRNFDITSSPLNQVQYSLYINATLYTYIIVQACTGPNPLAITVPFSSDPLADTFTAVANQGDGLQLGGFFYGLTRDDVAGLRYLLSTNNINLESSAFGSVLLNSSQTGGTSYGVPFVLFTSNYNAFAAISLTNGPATLTNLYPGLIINSYSVSFVAENIPNIVLVTNSLIGAPAGTQVLTIKTNGFTQTYVTQYKYTFANLIVPAGYASTNNNTTGYIYTVQVSPLGGAPGGTLTTNVSLVPVTLSGVPSGDYYIETNVCGPDLILSNLLTIPTQTSTLLYSLSNSAGLSFSQSLITIGTTHALVVRSVLCGASGGAGSPITNVTSLYQGIGGVKFVRANYDSLVGQYFKPVTNTYTMVSVTNSQRFVQKFQRVVTFPDFLLTAQDLASAPSDAVHGPGAYARSISFNQNNILFGLAGPGTINPGSGFIYNKVGPIFFNGPLSSFDTNGFLSEVTQLSTNSLFSWGSFDGSTNSPIVYPNGSSIDNLGNMITVRISPPQPALPNGKKGVAYPATTFTATGGSFSPPFVWSATGLPPGLALASNGIFSGTPTQSGVFDFTIILTDSLARSVQWNYSITIQ